MCVLVFHMEIAHPNKQSKRRKKKNSNNGNAGLNIDNRENYSVCFSLSSSAIKQSTRQTYYAAVCFFFTKHYNPQCKVHVVINPFHTHFPQLRTQY